MKPILPILLTILTGCASYRVVQTDTSASQRTIRLEVRALTLFSSAQRIERIQAKQSDQTQEFGTGSIGQTGGTNTAATIQALTTLLPTIRP